MTAPAPIRSLPGVQRDGTRFDSKSYVDAQWCRFQRGLPRKMGGYQRVVDSLSEVVYGLHSFSRSGSQYVHLGSSSELRQIVLDGGSLSGSNDRTPATLVASANNVWQFDTIYDVNAAGIVLVAHAAPNLAAIDSTVATTVWFGDVTGSGVLTATGLDDCSGGIVVVGNYLVSFGNDGRLQWSDSNDVSSIGAEAFPTNQKIIRGMRYRGSGLPAALLWSLDSLLMMTLNPDTSEGAPLWNFGTLTDGVSLISSRSVVEYNGVYMWPGVDRFQMFNGVVRDVPNTMNQDWFFDNLNFSHRQKVFGFKVPRFGEVWWCYPRGNATECTHAVIYNVREQVWYDTELPEMGRSDGLFAKVHNRPLMTSVEQNEDELYELYQHEVGVDAIRGSEVVAIPSSFETHEMSLLDGGDSSTLRVERVEPDFVQSGDMNLTVRGRSNARAEVIDGTSVDFPATPSAPSEETVPVKDAFRLASFRFSSNTVGGDYKMGKVMGHFGPSGKRVQS